MLHKIYFDLSHEHFAVSHTHKKLLHFLFIHMLGQSCVFNMLHVSIHKCYFCFGLYKFIMKKMDLILVFLLFFLN